MIALNHIDPSVTHAQHGPDRCPGHSSRAHLRLKIGAGRDA